MNVLNNRLFNYLREAKVEMTKVTWPTKKETTKYTLIVISVSVGVAVFLGGLDLLFQYLLSLVV
ncbi:TPA: preprotein translocase subunit SecE [Candidatus Falkowbacteria bacterium]|nr:preprotein translocase subunit SecE [Candidatus Falkowbacteria bacterium]